MACEIEPPDDPERSPENRFQLLGIALPFAFDTAAGRAEDGSYDAFLNRTDDPGGDDIGHSFRRRIRRLKSWQNLGQRGQVQVQIRAKDQIRADAGPPDRAAGRLPRQR